MKYDENIIKKLKTEFKNRFEDKGRIFFAPSRINIIGEHIDYNGGRVLPCAIEIGTYGIAKKNNENKLRLYSMNTNSGHEIDLENLDYKEEYGWVNYAIGMYKYMKEKNPDIGGIDGIIYGNIPTGSGLSSSASLEMLIGEIFNTIHDLKISKKDMALLGMKTENEHFGLNTGIMDQFAISLGRINSAIDLDTSTLDFEYIEVDLKENIFLILNTNKPRNLVVSKYNERREETQKALKIIQKYEDIENLSQLAYIENGRKLIDKIEDETLRKRALHVLEENLRVDNMIKAMEDENYEEMGKLLNESHKSLKNLYEVTGKELDAIVDAARKSEYTLGARMTGAGFGGCAIALVKKEGIEDLEKTVKENYKKETGLEGDIIISNIIGGPREIK